MNEPQVGAVEAGQRLLDCINAIRKARPKILGYATKKAEAIGTYRKKLGQEIMRLTSQGVKVTIIKELAHGTCWKEKQDCVLAEELYKGLIVTINCLVAELNGMQSYNRNLGF